LGGRENEQTETPLSNHIFCSAHLLASISGIVAAAPDQKGDPKIHEAPVSVAFVDAKAKVFTAVVPKDTPDNRGLGSIPSPVDKTHLKGKKVTQELVLASGSPEEQGGAATSSASRPPTTSGPWDGSAP